MLTSSKISNIQFELLKLYANNISEVDLIEVKKLLASYLGRIGCCLCKFTKVTI